MTELYQSLWRNEHDYEKQFSPFHETNPASAMCIKAIEHAQNVSALNMTLYSDRVSDEYKAFLLDNIRQVAELFDTAKTEATGRNIYTNPKYRCVVEAHRFVEKMKRRLVRNKILTADELSQMKAATPSTYDRDAVSKTLETLRQAAALVHDDEAFMEFVTDRDNYSEMLFHDLDMPADVQAQHKYVLQHIFTVEHELNRKNEDNQSFSWLTYSIRNSFGTKLFRLGENIKESLYPTKNRSNCDQYLKARMEAMSSWKNMAEYAAYDKTSEMHEMFCDDLRQMAQEINDFNFFCTYKFSEEQIEELCRQAMPADDTDSSFILKGGRHRRSQRRTKSNLKRR